MTYQDTLNEPKILVSMIAYREKYLAESVKDCYEKASNPTRLIFSIVSEQPLDSLHADLSFIPSDQLIYRKYDLSEYRGVLWSRHKTTEVDKPYDYILYTCGHNRFANSWDELAIFEYKKAYSYSDKPVLTFAAPEIFYSSEGEALINTARGRTLNYRRGVLDKDYVPGYGWSSQFPVEDVNDVVEETYLQYSWVFANKDYVKEVPLDPEINYHAEEIYMTVKTWCAGWRMFASPVIMYYHDTVKEYPKEQLSRMTTHRPWSDLNKEAFWQQSDETMIKLNNLLSGRTSEASKECIQKYCEFSGLDPKWCEYDPNYDKLEYDRHAQSFREGPAFKLI
jgi:hypothetical protein